MKSPFPKEVYKRNAEIYKLLSNPIRLEILNILKNKDARVNELINTLKLRKANVSQHLTLLRHARLVVVCRKGAYNYYRIADPRIVEPCKIFRELYKK